jgi:hypothetical protein
LLLPLFALELLYFFSQLSLQQSHHQGSQSLPHRTGIQVVLLGHDGRQSTRKSARIFFAF